MITPDITQLDWLCPRSMNAEEFIRLRPALERVLSAGPAREVYSVNTRSIYQLDDSELGSIAIKELRFETASRRWRAATVRRHRVLCEFNAAGCFAARGGLTPRLYGAALEHRGAGLYRVFIVLEWLNEALTLSAAVRDWAVPVRDRNLAHLARTLVGAASRGLVHGRHSSENILVTDPLEFQIIDFSHAQIFERFHPAGFSRDVARIGARLVLEEACTKKVVMQFFDEVARAAPAGSVDDRKIATEFDKVLMNSKRRQRLERNWHTFWRGFPSRLRD